MTTFYSPFSHPFAKPISRPKNVPWVLLGGEVWSPSSLTNSLQWFLDGSGYEADPVDRIWYLENLVDGGVKPIVETPCVTGDSAGGGYIDFGVDLIPKSGDFEVRIVGYFPSSPTAFSGFLSQTDGGSWASAFIVYYSSGWKVSYGVWNTNVVSFTPTEDAWNTVLIRKVGTTLYVSVNGGSESSATCTSTISSTITTWGLNVTAGARYPGRLAMLEITQGGVTKTVPFQDGPGTTSTNRNLAWYASDGTYGIFTNAIVSGSVASAWANRCPGYTRDRAILAGGRFGSSGEFITGVPSLAICADGNSKTLAAGKHGNVYSRLVPNPSGNAGLDAIGYTSSVKLAPRDGVKSLATVDTKYRRRSPDGSDRYITVDAALTGSDLTNAVTYTSYNPVFPFNDDDLIGLWLAKDATDNGTSLTMPDHSLNDLDLVATGASRPVIDTDGFAGGKGIIFAAMGNAPLKNDAIGSVLVGKTAVTVLLLAGHDPVPQTTAFVARMGTGADGDWALRTKMTSQGNVMLTAYLSGDDEDLVTVNGSEQLLYPKVIAAVLDLSRSTEQARGIYQNGKLISATRISSGSTSATLRNESLYVGSSTDGSSPFTGAIAGLVIVNRALTQSEVQTYTNYLLAKADLGTPKQVMWVGDSITAGADEYRYWLQQAYEADRGSVVDWGTYETIGDFGAGATFDENWHNAVAGSTVADAESRLTTLLASGTAYQPDIIAIMSGINNIILNGDSGADVAAEWESLLIAIYDVMPTAKIKLLNLIKNTSGGGAFTAIVDAANALGPTAVANAISARPGMNAAWVEHAYDVDLTDGTHPTTGPTGGAKQIADALWPLVKEW